ncbi:hypothetical protein MRX96_034450 [Rhipicephalus microplus]
MTPARRVHDSAGLQGSTGVARINRRRSGGGRLRPPDRLCPSPGELIARLSWLLGAVGPPVEMDDAQSQPNSECSRDRAACKRCVGGRSRLAIVTLTADWRRLRRSNVLALLKCPHVKGHVLEREPAVAVGLHSAVGAHISSSEREGEKKSARRKKPPANKAAGAQVRVSSVGPGSQVQRSQSACREEPAQP